ncbi:MAG TPA: FHA domain-containing protein [Gemmataceae bacterium]|nr:FHA domain-containing protein [Gemmataceae bacterium]
MKLRLQIAQPADASIVFEHHGSTVRMGRDPKGEVVLQAPLCDAVSWNHARVDLKSGGAELWDLGSSNGTFVNDRRVEERLPLRVGDRIQLGHTGPMIEVTEIDVNDPVPATPSTWALAKLIAVRNPQIAVSLAAICALVLIVVIFWPRGAPRALSSSLESTAPDVNNHTDAAGSGNKPPAVAADAHPPAKLPPTSSREPVGPSANEIAETKPVDLGTYLRPEKPSVLLQRPIDGEAWGLVAGDKRIYTKNLLLSLPGYRNTIHLDSGVDVMLWGNLPEFSKEGAPVLESGIVLDTPKPGIDLDVTLDRGRIRLSNRKAQGAAHIRLHFQQETWELTLPDQATEVAMELWGMYPPGVAFSKDPGEPGPLSCLGLFVKGKSPVEVKTERQTYTLPPPVSWLTWSTMNTPPIVGPKPLAKAPEWWTTKMVRPAENPRIVDMVLALEDFSEKVLGNPDQDIPSAIWREVRDPSGFGHSILGVLCLGALDDWLRLAEALEDQRPEVRGTAANALIHWSGRSRDNDLVLCQALQKREGYSREQAEIIVGLLHSFSPGELLDRKTYERLVDYLSNQKPVIRDLAFWHLSDKVPREAQKVAYDPFEPDPAKRLPAVEQWRRFLAEGRLPPMAGPTARNP